MRFSTVVLGATLTASLFLAPGAFAADPAPVTGAARVAETYDKAVADYDAGNYESAYRGFLEVWSVEKKAKTAANLGRAELRLGKYRDGATHLTLFLRLKKDVSTEDRRQATSLIDEAKRHIGTLRVTASMAGAEIAVDGITAGIAPLEDEVFVEPGAHEVTGRAAGLRAVERLEIAAGAEQAVALTLLPDAPAQAEPSVAGGPRRGPVAAAASPPEGAVAPSPGPDPVRFAVLVGGGTLAVAGIGAGVATGMVALSRQEEQDRCLERGASSQRSCWEALEPERAGLARASLAGFIAGGLFATGTLVYGIWSAGRPSGGPSVQVGVAGTGMTLSGRW